MRDLVIRVVARDDRDATAMLGRYADEVTGILPAGSPPIARAWSEEYVRVLVAREGGRAIACAGLREEARDAAEIKRFYVEPSARRRGVARELLATIEAEARDLGFRRIVLDTAASLEPAVRLYESNGYARVAPYNDNPHASAWFEKRLPLDDASLWPAFTRSRLPEPEWKHRTHLRVAFLHLARFGLEEAHLRMRVGIIRLNQAHGLEETAERGYHETLTHVWLSLALAAREFGPREAGSDAFVDAHPELLEKSAPLRFYTRETLLSLRARAVLVPPDLAPLP